MLTTLYIAASVVVAVALAWLVEIGVRRLRRRVGVPAHLARVRRPFRVTAGATALWWGLSTFGRRWPVATHAAQLVAIAAAAWLACAVLFAAEESTLPRLRLDVPDNRHVRAVRTQLTVLRRVTVAAVALVALAVALLTFRTARLVGTSLLASAGVAAAIAAFATNTLLSNLVAGLQLAFGGALRLDDVVVTEGEWGRVEEITLTYVVLHLWDDRRLVLPTSYFTSKPFENWTHTTSQLTGAVVCDVDWEVDLEALRSRLRSFLDGCALWDGRVGAVQVVDAVGGVVSVRALVSAKDATTLWDLRCAVREDLVTWLRSARAEPLTRAEVRITGP